MFAMVSAILIFMGMCFVFVSIANGLVHKSKRKNCIIPVTATVKKIIKEEHTYYNSDSIPSTGISYYPVYEYSLNGQIVTKRSEFGFSKPKVKEGQSVALLINPHDTEQFYCDADETTKVCAILGTVGAFLFCLGGIFLFFALR